MLDLIPTPLCFIPRPLCHFLSLSLFSVFLLLSPNTPATSIYQLMSIFPAFILPLLTHPFSLTHCWFLSSTPVISFLSFSPWISVFVLAPYVFFIVFSLKHPSPTRCFCLSEFGSFINHPATWQFPSWMCGWKICTKSRNPLRIKISGECFQLLVAFAQERITQDRQTQYFFCFFTEISKFLSIFILIWPVLVRQLIKSLVYLFVLQYGCLSTQLPIDKQSWHAVSGHCSNCQVCILLIIGSIRPSIKLLRKKCWVCKQVEISVNLSRLKVKMGIHDPPSSYIKCRAQLYSLLHLPFNPSICLSADLRLKLYATNQWIRDEGGGEQGWRQKWRRRALE